MKLGHGTVCEGFASPRDAPEDTKVLATRHRGKTNAGLQKNTRKSRGAMCSSLAVADLLFPKTVSLASRTLTRSSRAQIPLPQTDRPKNCFVYFFLLPTRRTSKAQRMAAIKAVSGSPANSFSASAAFVPSTWRWSTEQRSTQVHFRTNLGSFVAASKARAKCWACTGGAGAFLSTGSGSQPEL